MKVAHPRGVQQCNEISGKRRLTGTLTLTGNRHARSPLANHSGSPPGPEMKAPASAGTDARARLTIAAGRQANDTLTGESAQ
jgi:hypothetical protein